MMLSTAVQKKKFLVCRKIAAVMSVLVLTLLLPMNALAYETSTTGYETAGNSISNPDVIPIGFESGVEHYMVGTISGASDSDWYSFKPLRHGRVFVMVLCSGVFYNVDVYKGNTSTEIYSNTYTSYDCIADVSFIVTRDTINNSDMPTYYINVSSYNGLYGPTQYRIIVFYATYGDFGYDPDLQFPLALTGATREQNLKITSSVGYRTHDNKYHVGTDFGAYRYTTLYSVAEATVYRSERHTDHGNRVFLVLDVVDPYNIGNKINARNYHLEERSVFTNDVISKGTIVGTVGYSGLQYPNESHLHIDFNWIPSTNSNRFLQDYMAANPTYIINTVDVFPGLQYWAENTGYEYINS